ncbi:Oidioi.mRNA.OKI2018_I69.chr1.g302.t1.cds [Oikopleura dioica]|uniref:Oidioi.mRNA.OKI2018_I69.chr1.g302.t1.cds n=1 Tax=Oikopleura dioica TaxID=34765 RepID=A0ABN7SJX8_OIKDI|nr:Oidioi.mRNA.OKI2018_I69.chr1.g302.t1.cds [Oikopleura dioica]
MFLRIRIVRPNVRYRARFQKAIPKNRFDGNPLESPPEMMEREKEARKDSKFQRKTRIVDSFIPLEGTPGAQNHPLLQNMIDEKPKEEFSAIDEERSRQMEFRNSDYGYLVTTNRGRAENFDYNGNYRGNQHIQSNLYWKEAAEIEEQMTPELILSNFRRLLSSLENGDFETDEKRVILKACLEEMCDSIGSSSSENEVILPTDFVNRLRLSLSSIGIQLQPTEIDENSRKCVVSNVILDHKFSLCERKLTDYLMKIYEIISLSQVSQLDLLSKPDAENVKELNSSMENFLNFADSISQVDVIIDLQNFAHRVLKSPPNRPYHCSTFPKHFLLHLFSSEQEFYQGEAELFYEALGKGFEVVMNHARQKFKSKEERKELKVLVLTPEGANISSLIQSFSTDPDVDITCFKTPKLRKTSKNRIRKGQTEKTQESSSLILHFDDFFALLAASLFENALLISEDKFQNIFPYHLKRGYLEPYSAFMSSARAKRDEAEKIENARDEWRRMLSPKFREKVLFHLIDRYKGIRLDYFKNELDVRPQFVDDFCFLPYQTVNKDGKAITKWLFFSIQRLSTKEGERIVNLAKKIAEKCPRTQTIMKDYSINLPSSENLQIINDLDHQ